MSGKRVQLNGERPGEVRKDDRGRGKRGTLHINPETGEKRIKFGELTLTQDDRPRVSLSDILTGKAAKLPGIDKGTEVVVKPINLFGLAMLEKRYGSLDKVPSYDNLSAADQLAISTILINQDGDEADALSETQVGKLINGENMNLIAAALEQCVRPLYAAIAQRMEKALAMAAAQSDPSRSAGLGSATSASRPGSAARMANSAGSPSGG